MTRAEWRRNWIIYQCYPPSFSDTHAKRHRRLCGAYDGCPQLRILRRYAPATVTPAGDDCMTFDAVKGF